MSPGARESEEPWRNSTASQSVSQSTKPTDSQAVPAQVTIPRQSLVTLSRALRAGLRSDKQRVRSRSVPTPRVTVDRRARLAVCSST